MTTGDYDLKVREIDQIFAINPIPDSCLDAAIRASANFSDKFPGWQLYCKIVRGESVYDRNLDAWAIGLARALSRARRKDGRPVVRMSSRGNWLGVAALDALHRCVTGRFLDSGARIADRLGVRYERYYAVRQALAGGMLIGFETFRSELHYQYITVVRESRRAA